MSDLLTVRSHVGALAENTENRLPPDHIPVFQRKSDRNPWKGGEECFSACSLGCLTEVTGSCARILSLIRLWIFRGSAW